MPFFVHQKMEILSKILPQIPNFGNFVKKFSTNPEFLQFRQILLKINIFVTTASFRHFVSFSSKTKSFIA